MSKIKSKNTKREVQFRKALWRRGFRYRINSNIKGHPDILFNKKKIAIFIDGDFWHGRDWEKLKLKLNDYWQKKILRNMERDKEVTEQLRHQGWTVLRFWEKDLKHNMKDHIEHFKEIYNNK